MAVQLARWRQHVHVRGCETKAEVCGIVLLARLNRLPVYWVCIMNFLYGQASGSVGVVPVSIMCECFGCTACRGCVRWC